MSSIAEKLKNLKDYRSIDDSEKKDQIIIEYSPLIKYIAKKIARRLPSNVELDDLISCGVIGLMDAIDKFDPSRDNKFKTYAEFRIRGAILDELRAQDWVPRSVREKAKLLEKTYSKLEVQLGRMATDEEMCTELKCTKEQFYSLLNKVKAVYFLNIDDSASFNRGDKKLLAGLMYESRFNNPMAAISYNNIKEIIRECIKALPEKQRLVLSLYYYEGLNLREIGQVLDVTESRVSQLHTQALMRLQLKLKAEIDSPEDITGQI